MFDTAKRLGLEINAHQIKRAVLRRTNKPDRNTQTFGNRPI